MLSKEEITDAAFDYAEKNHSQEDNDFQNAMNIAVMKAFVAGAEYAIGRLYSYIDDRGQMLFDKLPDASKDNFTTEEIKKIGRFMENEHMEEYIGQIINLDKK